jgi:hypothetical protein
MKIVLKYSKRMLSWYTNSAHSIAFVVNAQYLCILILPKQLTSYSVNRFVLIFSKNNIYECMALYTRSSSSPEHRLTIIMSTVIKFPILQRFLMKILLLFIYLIIFYILLPFLINAAQQFFFCVN